MSAAIPPATPVERLSQSAANQSGNRSVGSLSSEDVYAPGTTVKIRDEEWLVESSTEDGDMVWLRVRGVRGLVQDTVATFSPQLDRVDRVSPADTVVVADDSPRYRRSRLWLEATLRKSPEPVNSTAVTVANEALVDALEYQVQAVRQALGEDNPRCRILLADAVGLGKTIEIGMILSELVRRGKGKRILIVSPRHVLEQTQLELWSRFGLPFVRLDSAGIQRVRQKIPATRNPFTYYPRAIVSIDTLKSDLYLHQISRQPWDAVVIDESHNLSNRETLNNRLARTLATNTDALILASATPHNGRAESFAELISLLDPTAVTPDGQLIPADVQRLVVRRHRHSPAVSREVGSDWAERNDPVQLVAQPSVSEDAIAAELAETWLYPVSGQSPIEKARGAEALFPWTLAKAFLSSPAALLETVRSRLRRTRVDGSLGTAEEEALSRLEQLCSAAVGEPSGKFEQLESYLREIGVKRGSPMRAVVFAERVATLHWLEERLPAALGMPRKAFAVMHGGLDDIKQQELVDEFSRESSPLRILITSDVASEGVNLHRQCHHLIHYDLPWSLIRIEQRNGRIDRYGQKYSPQIAMLVMQPSDPQFSGDIRVLTKLVEREHESHRALGESSPLMGKYSVAAEEEAIKRVLAGGRPLDQVVLQPEQVETSGDETSALLAALFGGDDTVGPTDKTPDSETAVAEGELYPTEIEFLADALEEAFAAHTQHLPVGVEFEYDAPHGIATFTPPRDLVQRLESLPQTYLKDRRVTERVVLATTPARGNDRIAAARSDNTGSSWPDASYLTPLHPVIEWATDRSLAALGRGEIFAVRGGVLVPTVLLLTSLTNVVGAVTASSWVGIEFPDPANPDFSLTRPYASPGEAIATYKWQFQDLLHNTGPVGKIALLQSMIRPAVKKADNWAATVFAVAEQAANVEQEQWAGRAEAWRADAATLTQRKEVRSRREAVEAQAEYLRALTPRRRLVRPILVVVPPDWPAAAGTPQQESITGGSGPVSEGSVTPLQNPVQPEEGN